MAQRHSPEDTPSLLGSKDTSSIGSQEPQSMAVWGETYWLVVFGLGANAWVTHVLFMLMSSGATPVQHAVGVSALLCLTLGVATRALANTPRRLQLARWLLLCVYPASLALALGSERFREAGHTALSMPLCAAALLAYGIAAAVACKEPLALLEVESHPLSNSRETRAAAKPLRRVVIGIVLAGSFAIAVVAPLWPPYGRVASAWGEAAEAGTALSALVASATAVSVVAIHLGAILRRGEPHVEALRVRRNRLATLLFLTLLGFVTYVLVMP